MWHILTSNVMSMQEDSIDPELVPRPGMSFRTEKDAIEFFSRYAEKVGFGINLGNGKPYSRIVRCSKEGKCEFHKKDSPRKRNKTSKKTGCKSKLKLQFVKNRFKQIERVVIEQAHLDYNHKFLKPGETQHLSSHKKKEPVIFEYIDELHKSEVPPQCVKNIMREMHGGDENVPITSRDLENR